jgi:hypothetical protein
MLMVRKNRDIEDRKDKRIKMQGTQQSELINQRKNNLLPTDFESSGNDVLGGIGLEQFEPKMILNNYILYYYVRSKSRLVKSQAQEG